MKKIIYIVFLTLMMATVLAGCGEKEQTIQNTLDKVEQSNHPQVENNQEINIPEPKYSKISAEEAKKIMDGDSDFIILDVRTQEEYREGHIKDAVLLPVDNIMNEAGPVIGGKDKTILVYCRSGNRSNMAAAKLAELGYTDIRDFGGINNWPYEIIVE